MPFELRTVHRVLLDQRPSPGTCRLKLLFICQPLPVYLPTHPPSQLTPTEEGAMEGGSGRRHDCARRSRCPLTSVTARLYCSRLLRRRPSQSRRPADRARAALRSRTGATRERPGRSLRRPESNGPTGHSPVHGGTLQVPKAAAGVHGATGQTTESTTASTSVWLANPRPALRPVMDGQRRWRCFAGKLSDRLVRGAFAEDQGREGAGRG